MNIFVVHKDPIEAARALCDIHVNKMIVEGMQMLTTALKQSGFLAPNELPFRKDGITRYSGNAHPHHPCTKWVGERMHHTYARCPNYSWLYFHTEELLRQYNFRYGKTHGCFDAFKSLPKGSYVALEDVQNFVQAMPDEFKIEDDSVKAYRQFYHTKSFAKWAKGSDAPEWWMQPLADLVGQVKA